jgi:hypothetical protein
MTLILSLANARQTIQASDRLLSREGRPADPESDKAIVLQTADARMAVGYTGLATTAGWKTHDELVTTLLRVAPPDYSIGPMSERLRDALTIKFQRRRVLQSLPRARRRLTVMVSGYRYDEDPARAWNVLLTNFQDWETGLDGSEAWAEFKLTPWRERRPLDGPMTLIQRVGAWSAVDHRQLEEVVRPMLERDVDVRRLIAKAVQVVRDAATRSRGIGTDLTVAVIPRETQQQAWTEYHPEAAKHRVVLPMQVIARPDLVMAMHGEVKADDPTTAPPMSGPILPRNAPCFCGSGRKYKKCHGI